MYIPAELTIKNYKPLLLEKGMLFVTTHRVSEDDIYPEIWEITERQIRTHLPEEFFSIYGYPVELYLQDEDEKSIADHDEIAWWNDGKTEELRNITLKDINKTFELNGGILELDVDEFYASMDINIPKMFEGKVILKELTEENEE